jgi:N-acetylneuraminic acid mutarotase
MIVWGGTSGSVRQTGGRYDPVADAWTSTSLTSAPSARMLHTAVWTGSEMIVWGGGTNQSKEDTGGRYDPALDQWTPIDLGLLPSPRWRHTAVWTGSEMIVFGGEDQDGTPKNDGARYDPSANYPEHAWFPMSTAGAVRHTGHAAVWTGDEMIVWGGSSLTGQRYDPSSNAWTSLPQVDLGTEPDERTAAVWSGTEMIVWHRGRGARYDPSTNTWIPNIQPVELSGKANHSAVWTGTEMIVFGGRTDDTGPIEGFNTGGRYDPVLDTWDATTLHGAPPPRESHTAVWTGSEMIVWGGGHGIEGSTDTGGRYDPSSDTWVPTSLVSAPHPRRYHTAVWTGSEMIVWGGSPSTATGGRYDPPSDTWIATSVIGAPDARSRHTAVWAETEMIIWGGYGGGAYSTGGRYDPVTDSWHPTSTLDAPESAYLHDAVWTGDEMVVIGDGAAGRYAVASDSWSPLNAPAWVRAIAHPTAVWTGQHVIVWGGVSDVNDGGTDMGFRFPLDGTARFMSLVNAPPGRYRHTAVWTGEAMIVWGGITRFSLPFLHSGGLYYSRVDADGDGVASPCDCAPEDPGAFDVPWEILDVRWLSDGTTIVWESDAPNSGPDTRYDLVRGELTGLPVGGAGEVCLEPDSGDTSAGDATPPPAGSGFYYLVRGENVCGAGSYGTDSFGGPRTTATCP